MVLIFPLTTLRSAEVRTLMDIKPYSFTAGKI